MSQFYIKSYCSIKEEKIFLNGEKLFESSSKEYSTFIKEAYKKIGIDYPKFFKMDNLSKLAFIAAELLLQDEQLDEKGNDIAIVFSNSSSSIDTDRKHQMNIEDESGYFPSPAVFVYTLPNICIGEISIRHKLYSENSFFIFANLNIEYLQIYAEGLLQEGKAEQVLTGWINFDGSDYEAFLYLIAKKGKIEHSVKEITRLYNVL